MRLADWDAATTAHVRSLWLQANRAHLPYKEAGLEKSALKEALKDRLRSHAGESEVPAEPDWRSGSEDERARWRVTFALARLLSTHPVVLAPEAILREAVAEAATAAGEPLAKPIWQQATRRKAAHTKPPVPADGLRSVWKSVEASAARLEERHGPLSRLTPMLERYRADGGITDATLAELWYEAVDLFQKEPANPVPPTLIRRFDGEDARAQAYHQFDLPKRRGGIRTITVPDRRLKWLQRSLLQVLTHLFPRHKCAVGFERGASVVSHARAHSGKRWVYVVDIRDFFPSITRSRVYGMLRAKPFGASEPVARYLANLATHGGALPQGAPTSPVLANLLCRRMDARLFKWARERGYQYTRYADDLAFSTNRAEFPEADREAIGRMIEGEGFTVHPEKRKLMPWYGRQLVTGLVVNEKPNLPREYVRGLRALLFNVKTFTWASQVNRVPLAFEGDSYLMYKRRAISVEDYGKVRASQREHHALVQPGAALPRVTSVEDLRRLVRGRIEYVKAVKGEDSPVYKRLLAAYREALSEAKAVERFDRTRAQAYRAYVPEAAPEGRGADAHHYRAFKEAAGRLVNGEADREAIIEWLEERAGDALECRWLLRQTLPTSELVGRAQAVAYALDTHPHETAQFFREFNTYRSFRGLLHAPTDQDGDTLTYPNETVLTVAEVVGNCEKALAARTLPDKLARQTGVVLDACTAWLQRHPTRHPWLTDDDALRETLLGYVYLTRFQPKMLRAENLRSKYDYERGRPLDLFARLRPFVGRLGKPKGERVHLGRRGLRFHMYTPPLRKAVEMLIQSLVDNGSEATVTMDRVADPRRPEVQIVVEGSPGALDMRPEFDEILGGDTQGVLYLLRGYGRWTIEAPFVDDGPHRFDVMSAKVDPLAPEDAPLGVRHTITLYQ